MINGRGINIGYRIYMDIITGENMIIWTLFIGQCVYPFEGKGVGIKWVERIVILDSCEYYLIRVHENLVQHPSNNISIE